MKTVIIWTDPETRWLFTAAFKRAGYNPSVDWFNNIEDGLNACIENPPDLLIVQRTVGKQDDGFELCRQLREIESLPYFPIVIGFIDVWQKWEIGSALGYQAGADLCFGRVFDVVKVVKDISKLLDESIEKK